MVTICCGTKSFANIRSILLDKDGTIENSQHFLVNLARARVEGLKSQLKSYEKVSNSLDRENFAESLLVTLGIKNNILDPTGVMAVASRPENEWVAITNIVDRGYSTLQARTIVERAFKEASENCQKTVVSCPLFAGVIPMLQRFSEVGLQVGIVSADTTDEVTAFIQRHELSRYIQLALGSDRNFGKPDPKLYIEACEILEVAPTQTIMIGDSLGDITMAREAGAGGTIGITWSKSLWGHLNVADVEISHLQEVKVLE